jgi:hypothetical protein
MPLPPTLWQYPSGKARISLDRSRQVGMIRTCHWFPFNEEIHKALFRGKKDDGVIANWNLVPVYTTCTGVTSLTDL